MLAAAGAALLALVVFALPASAELRTFRVRLATGQIVTVTVDAPAGVPMSQVPGLPGVPIEELTPPPAPSLPGLPPGTTTTPQQQQQQSSQSQSGNQQQGSDSSGGGGGGGGSSSQPNVPHSSHGQAQQRSGSSRPANSNSQAQSENNPSKAKPPPTASLSVPPVPPILPGGVKPNFFDTLPGPVTTQSVPSFVISNFRMPIFLLPIYQAAGIEYGVRWEALAGINEIETDYGRDLSVSSAGAQGWMQFMPDTWRTYGVDANGDRKADPYNPADAIFAAARYLKAAGAQSNLPKAIFAYNHATWYVTSVMMRAQLLATYPADFIAALTGLTEARFPVVGRSKYGQNDITQSTRQVRLTDNATKLDAAQALRHSIDIFARSGSPVIAVNDGIVKKIGTSKKLGRYVVLQDVYGNTFTYSGLGSVARVYPVPKEDVLPSKAALEAARASALRTDPRPTQPATAGSQPVGDVPSASPPASSKVKVTSKSAAKAAPPAPVAAPTYKARLFAHPERPNPKQNGGADQILAQQFGSDASPQDFASYSGVYAFNSQNAVLRQLRPGATVVAGTILGHVGQTSVTQPPHLHFELQPAGKGAPKIDPKPILDGWRLLDSTNIYRPNGKNVLYKSGDSMSIGQVLLLSKAQLQQRVLSDPRIQIYPCGRNDIATGQIDQRVLATLEYLAESGLWPSVGSLKCGHTEFTSSGNVSEHSTGDAVDIMAINGTPIEGHQQAGGIAEQTVRRLMLLQGDMRPHDIVSLVSLGANTQASPDHHDRIHVGFAPLFGQNAKLGRETASILNPGQWQALASRLDNLANPVVPTSPSKYAVPVPGKPGD